MPNPKLETYKNKATGTVYDYTDAAAQAALAGILDGTDINNFSDVETALATKVDKVTGKGLSTNDYDDTEKAKVAGAFPRSEQAVLGAKNMCCITGVADKSSNTDVTWSANSVRVKSDVAAQYINTNLNIKSLPKNKTVKISFDATITAGDGIAIVKGRPSGGSYAALLNQSVGSTSSYEVEFNTGSNDDFQLNLYASKGTASTGDITYNNIMISFDGGEYAPYAMTNKELTENVVEKSITGLSFVSTYIDENNSEAAVTRCGHIAEINLKMVVTTQIPAYTKFAENVPKFHISGKSFSGFAFDNSNGNKGYRFYLDGAGTINNHVTPIPVGTYYISLVYICRD